jgi:ABC-type glutathione transport system ATPase component
MLVIEHDMPLITSISDTILALDLGRTVVRGTPDAVLHDPQVVAAYLGTDTSVIERSGTAKAAAAPRKARGRATTKSRG